jgi:hypothetical protein
LILELNIEYINKIQNKQRIGRSRIAEAAKKGSLTYGFYWEYEKINDIDGEKWVSISRNDKEFYISNYGRIKNMDSYNRLEIQINGTDGYMKYICNGKGFLVHRLVAETFIPSLDKLLVVNHNDCNKKNNHIDNLEWVTRSQNCIHAWKNDLIRKSKKVYQINIETGKIIQEYRSVKEADDILGIKSTKSRIRNHTIKNGIYWSYDPPET